MLQWGTNVINESGEFSHVAWDNYFPDVLAEDFDVNLQAGDQGVNIAVTNNSGHDLETFTIKFVEKDTQEIVQLSSIDFSNGSQAEGKLSSRQSQNLQTDNYELMSMDYMVNLGHKRQIVNYDARIDDYRVMDSPTN